MMMSATSAALRGGSGGVAVALVSVALPTSYSDVTSYSDDVTPYVTWSVMDDVAEGAAAADVRLCSGWYENRKSSKLTVRFSRNCRSVG